MLSFTDIDDMHILTGNIISELFIHLYERFIEIQNQSLLLFNFKFHTKKKLNLNSIIKTANAIASNWYSYTIKSDKKRIGFKE